MIMKTTLRLLALLALVIVNLHASAQIFYKVEGNGLEKPSYLFGTHHLAPLSEFNSIPEAVAAFNEAETVVGELDMTDMMAVAQALQPYMTAPQDSTLSKLYTPEKLDRLSKEFSRWSGGVSLAMLDAMKPMVPNSMVAVAMIMDQLPDFNANEQLDTYFQLKGRQLGKEIVGLETAAQQGEYLYGSTSIADQADALAETLEDPQKAIDGARRLNQAYRDHDIEALLRETMAEEEKGAGFMAVILDHRNADWLTKLPVLLKESPSFVAVGALHLVGEKGIVAGLRNLGYTVTPIR